MNINELIKEAHKNAIAHGWWEEDKPIDEVLALIHSELSEALEEFRNGHGLNEVYAIWNDKQYSYDYAMKTFMPKNPLKPEGIPAELADACIRIFDYLGNKDGWPSKTSGIMEGLDKPFPGFITLCHAYVSKAWDYSSKVDEWLAGLVDTIYSYCLFNKIDLENAIRIKMEYNKTRPYRHGGKKA